MSEPSANRLIEVIDLKTYLNIKTSDDDELLEDICNRASSIFENFCNRKFKYVNSAGVAQSITEYHDGIGNKIFLNYFPIISVTSVHDDSDRVFGADTLIDSGDYIVHTESGIIEMDSDDEFSGLTRGVKVVYKAGYTSDLPYEVVNAVLEIAGLVYKEKDHLGLSNKAFSDGSVAFFTDKFSPWTKSVIEKYSKPSIRE